MAVGDVKQGHQRIANGADLDIRPPAGEEWVIHNLYYSTNVAIKLVNSTNGNILQFDSDSSSGARLGLCIHITNTIYLRFTNAGISQGDFAYDGIQTK